MDMIRNLHRYWRNRVPIRAKLAIWYLFSFSIILLVFAGVLEGRIQANLESEADNSLKLAAERVQEYIKAENGTLALADNGDLSSIESDYSVYLLAPDEKTILAHYGIEQVSFINPHGKPSFFTTRNHWTSGQWHKREDWRVHTEPVHGSDGSVIGWLQIARIYDRDHSLGVVRGHLCLALPLGMLLGAFGGILLAARALSPIDEVTQTAQKINATDLHQRLNYKGPHDEVGRLAMTFDHMLDRLQAGFERERRFTGDAAHELRTPLTALKGQISVTLGLTRTPDEYVETLHSMEQQVDRLIHLSSDLLFMARLDYCKQRTASEEIILNDWLHVLEDQVRPLAEAKGITLLSHMEPDLAVKGNMDLLIRLFLNLLDNAIKYTPNGGQITIKAQQTESEAQVVISDTGPGIPADQISQVFERFYRVEDDRARRQDAPGQNLSGAGLGLAIAQEIARIHGGFIEVSSEIGKGSTFTVHLPK